MVLLGNPGTRRTTFLEQAAEASGLPVLLVEWTDWQKQLPEGELYIKIDPPLWDSCALEELAGLVQNYRCALEALAHMAEERPVTFFNHPRQILALLDKRACRERLVQAGIPVTDVLALSAPDAGLSGADAEPEPDTLRAVPRNTRQLTAAMEQQHIHQVFIKPVCGSGAAGVAAFRFQPGTGRMALYTCAAETEDGGLVNTKRLAHYADPGQICPLLDQLLALDCMVERWHAKATFHGMSYDLRVVMQAGEPDYILARLSHGPITNLHLNNHPLELAALGLSEQTLSQIRDLCRAAMACYPALTSAGLDILLEKGSLRPRIIEMNAQGDLIYQDIFHENHIYRHQTEIMKGWLKKE